MGFQLTTKDYVEYIKKAYEKIHANGDYITELDSATGDGDHWTNINMGFEKLVEASAELETMSLFDAFKKISMIRDRRFRRRLVWFCLYGGGKAAQW